MMRERKDARAGTAIPTRAVENGTMCKTAHASTKNDTTIPPSGQTFRVADLLLCGAENAIPRRQLMSMTGYRDRELRLKIEAERREGVPILSDNQHGYFLPGDSAELERFVKSMRHRSAEIARVADAVEQAEV